MAEGGWLVSVRSKGRTAERTRETGSGVEAWCEMVEVSSHKDIGAEGLERLRWGLARLEEAQNEGDGSQTSLCKRGRYGLGGFVWAWTRRIRRRRRVVRLRWSVWRKLLGGLATRVYSTWRRRWSCWLLYTPRLVLQTSWWHRTV